MPDLTHRIAALLAIPICFVGGLWARPPLAGIWHAAFPPPQYTIGEHRTLFAGAGAPVVMCATTACSYCTKTCALFFAGAVTYTEYRIGESAAARADFIARDGIGVPLLYIGARRIDGFREHVIEDALATLRTGGSAIGYGK